MSRDNTTKVDQLVILETTTPQLERIGRLLEMGKPNGSRLRTSGSSTGSALIKIAKLEQTLLSTSHDPNPLLPLIALSRNAEPDIVHKAVWALHRVFIRYVSEGKVGGITSSNIFPWQTRLQPDQDVDVAVNGQVTEAREVKGWVRDRLLEYVEVLSGLMRDSEAALRVSDSHDLARVTAHNNHRNLPLPCCSPSSDL